MSTPAEFLAARNNNQCSTSIEEINRKAIKSKNTHGAPVRLQSKILAVIGDPTDDGRIYVAESAGTVRRVVLEVGETPPLLNKPYIHQKHLLTVNVR